MKLLQRLAQSRTVLVNFATDEFLKSQRLNSISATTIGEIPHVVSYRSRDIDYRFRKENQKILTVRRGAGLWLWKPYFILETLRRLRDGDLLFYCDSGSIFVHSASTLLQMAREAESVLCFSVGLPEIEWSKRDALVYMDMDRPEAISTPQRLASFQIWFRCSKTLALAEEYLFYCTNWKVISDDPSICGLPEYDGFRENRHDQTVFSLLTKRHGIQAFRDPSRTPSENCSAAGSNEYPQVLAHTRARHLTHDRSIRGVCSSTAESWLRWLQLRWKLRRLQ
jgi:hypothetical protein